MEQKILLEADLTESQIVGNRIKSIVLLGRVSKNGREYSNRAMEDLVQLAEGGHIYLNHPNQQEERTGRRDLRDFAGKIEYAHRQGDKVYGDAVLLEDDEVAKKFIAIAKMKPQRIGMSINALGSTKRVDGKTVVETLTSLESIDLVGNAATTSNLFETDKKETELSEAEIDKALSENDIDIDEAVIDKAMSKDSDDVEIDEGAINEALSKSDI